MARHLPTYGDVVGGPPAPWVAGLPHAADRASSSQRGRGCARAAQGGEPAACWRLQVPRRLQQDRPGGQGRLSGGRGGLLLGQPCTGRGGRGHAARAQIDHRHAGRRAAPQDRAHQGFRRRGGRLRSRDGGSRRHCAGDLREAQRPPTSILSTIPTSSPDKAPPASR